LARLQTPHRPDPHRVPAPFRDALRNARIRNPGPRRDGEGAVDWLLRENAGTHRWPLLGRRAMPACVPTTGSLEDYTMKTVAPAGARTPRRHLSQVLGASWVLMCSLASLLPCLAQPNAVRDGKPDFTRVRKFIQEQIVATTVPSVAVAVARRGEILWEEGFGWADRENRVPATEHTMYETASLTKSFTATAIMLLAEQKKLDLDRPANDYLGAARLSSPKWDPAGGTVRHLPTHTPGWTHSPAH